MRIVLAIALSTFLLAAVAACGDGEGQAVETRGLDVVASSGLAADIVRNVAGDDAAVTQVVPDGANPHFHEASAQDRRAMDEADLVVYFGEDLEQNLVLDDLRAPTFEINEHVGPLLELPAEDPAQDDDHEEHGAEDPHVWMDPTRIQSALPALAAALAELDPDNAGAYAQRAREYATRLGHLDDEIAELVAALPERERKLVSSHRTMGYFADRYGFEVIGAPFGLTPEAEAGARTVAQLIEDVERSGVPAVFAQEGDDPRVLRRIADAAGVAVVDDLLVEGLGARGRTYEEALRHTARRIVEALAR